MASQYLVMSWSVLGVSSQRTDPGLFCKCEAPALFQGQHPAPLPSSDGTGISVWRKEKNVQSVEVIQLYLTFRCKAIAVLWVTRETGPIVRGCTGVSRWSVTNLAIVSSPPTWYNRLQFSFGPVPLWPQGIPHKGTSESALVGDQKPDIWLNNENTISTLDTSYQMRVKDVETFLTLSSGFLTLKEETHS
jgi:hypothetical protein